MNPLVPEQVEDCSGHVRIFTPGQLVTREALADAFADGGFDSHRLDSLVYRLRRKVADGCGTQLPLDAIHGEGYVLDATR